MTNDTLANDIIYAQKMNDENIHIFVDAKVINPGEDSGCRVLQNQTIDTAHFVLAFIIEP